MKKIYIVLGMLLVPSLLLAAPNHYGDFEIQNGEFIDDGEPMARKIDISADAAVTANVVFRTTPSTAITAGTNISWVGNELRSVDTHADNAEVATMPVVQANTAKTTYPGDELTSDELAAINSAATAPTAANPFVTEADAGSGDSLPDATDGQMLQSNGVNNYESVSSIGIDLILADETPTTTGQVARTGTTKLNMGTGSGTTTFSDDATNAATYTASTQVRNIIVAADCTIESGAENDLCFQTN